MLLHRVNYINKAGFPCSKVVRILKKQSKVIRVQDPEDGNEFPIDRHSVESISDPEKEKGEKQ